MAVTTSWGVLLRRCAEDPTRPAIRVREAGGWRTRTREELTDDVRACAASLVASGLRPGERVGLWFGNGYEWVVADLAITACGAVSVTPHPGMPPALVRDLFAAARVSVQFVSGEGLSLLEPPGERIRVSIFLGTTDAKGPVRWDEFLALGGCYLVADFGYRPLYESADDESDRSDEAAAVLFTSGTGGRPQPVELTHGNLMSNVRSIRAACDPGPDAVILNWLPLSHVYARTADYLLAIQSGAELVLAESPATLPRDLAAVRPTHLAGVPRFYEKLWQTCALEGPGAGASLRAALGGRVRWASCGGAPLPAELARAFADAGLPLMEGYGLTETGGVIALNVPDAHRPGTVGRALPGVDIRIAEDGEILVRGDSVMTAPGGWLRTGDLGRLDNGFLSVIGRKKDLIALSSGKKVAPEAIESLLRADPLVRQVVVLGEGRSYLTAVVVPDPAEIARGLGLAGPPAPDLLRSDAARLFVLARLERLQSDLPRWDRVRDVLLRGDEFSPEAGEVTPSGKLRRGVIAARHRDAIEALGRA